LWMVGTSRMLARHDNGRSNSSFEQFCLFTGYLQLIGTYLIYNKHVYDMIYFNRFDEAIAM